MARVTAKNSFGGIVDAKVLSAVEGQIGKTVHDGKLDADAKIDFAFRWNDTAICVQTKFGGGRSCHFPDLDMASVYPCILALGGKNLAGIILNIVGWVDPNSVFDGRDILAVILESVKRGDEVVYYSPQKRSIEKHMSFSKFQEIHAARNMCTRA